MIEFITTHYQVLIVYGAAAYCCTNAYFSRRSYLAMRDENAVTKEHLDLLKAVHPEHAARSSTTA